MGYPRQPQPPVVYVEQPKNTAATVGIWLLVLYFVGPIVLIGLCCVGCIGLGGLGMATDPYVAPTP